MLAQHYWPLSVLFTLLKRTLIPVMNNLLSTYASNISKIILFAVASLLFTLSATAQASENSPATLAIKLELKQQQGEYHPPYVAAWLELSLIHI